LTEPGDGQGVQGGMRLNSLVVAAIGGIVILLGILWFFSTNRNPDQDKLTNPQMEQLAQSDSAKLCTGGAVYKIIKGQLFGRAAQIRGADAPEFARIAGAAVLRVDNPVLETEENGTLDCSGTFYLELPPGVAVAGGSRTLTADVDYTVRPPGDAGSWAVALRNADPIVSALAALTQTAAPAPGESETNAVAPEANVAASESAGSLPGPATGAPGRPSFDCANASTSGEAAVCDDGGLAALDVNMATQYRRALATATPAQKVLLQSTRDRFLAYRDRCPSRQCMADGYVGRMREIRDIMEGRFQQR
jgi:uncharacterized protein YecT (DUF1311 family)